MRLSLVITTYERPDALGAVLASVAAQTRRPDEVIVADDGSGASTAAVVQHWRTRLGAPLQHCRQDKLGFRLTRLRNVAIRAASGDYLVFIDGDMLLHRDFIADHARAATPARFTQGVRILLDAAATARLLTDPAAGLRLWSAGIGGLRRLYMLRSTWLSQRLRVLGNRLISIKGCNQAFWREDLHRVNGFEELIEGWGPEDKELCARLQNAGVQRQSLLAGGIAFHLHHPAASRKALEHNRAIYLRTLKEGRLRSERGLAEHEPAAQSLR